MKICDPHVGLCELFLAADDDVDNEEGFILLSVEVLVVLLLVIDGKVVVLRLRMCMCVSR